MIRYSIIIVAYKDYASLEKCISLIRKREEQDYEICVLDNTPREFVTGPLCVQGVYWDGEDHGFAWGCNKAVEYAQGETLIFLNPDTEPTGDWLDRMCRGFEEGYDAIGTTSDYIAGLQSWRLWQDYPKPFADTKLIIPVCMAIKAETFRELGGFDESFFLGCEDLDFSWRMQLAGKRMGIATDVFIHHVGHTGFNLTPDKDKIIRAGEDRIREKLLEFYGPDVPSSEEIWGCKILATKLKRQRLSVCMIVRDSEAHLLGLLPQIEFADEIILVDTKPDEERLKPVTEEDIVKWCEGRPIRFRDAVIKAFKFPWVDDFAAARNFALSKSTGDWVLWLDADDRVPPESAALIDALIHKPGNMTALQVVHFAFRVENTNKEGWVTDTFIQSRLFPRLPGIEWGGLGGCHGYVHESYFENCNRLGLQLVTTNITIQHTGYADEDTVKAKQARNLRLLEKEPDNCFKWYNMGTSYMALGDHEKAEGAFRKALDLSEGESSGFIDNCRYTLALALMRQGKDSIEYLEGNTKADALYLLGELLIQTGEVERGCDSLYAYLKLGQVNDLLGTNCNLFRPAAVKTLTEIGVLKV